ncbi:helix-turn-helix domain-containing protein [Fodinicurvata sp. EGI_FJ10296]|uniref:helix-turn-helix domain-containing protein n=1 Tax=Fodinicurvata sp. EGI_FJ10296 TaxID=3231908 RepID=UPI003454AC88
MNSQKRESDDDNFSQLQLLTLRQVCRLAHLSERSVRSAIKRGELRAAKVGGQWRVSIPAFGAWTGVDPDTLSAVQNTSRPPE